MAKQLLELGKSLQIMSLDKVTYTNVNVVNLKALGEDAQKPTSLVDGMVEIIDLKGTKLEEIEDGEIDQVSSVGKFCVGNDKVIKMVIDKSIVDMDKIKETYEGYRIAYELRQDLKLDENNYDLKIYNGMNEKLFDSCPVSLEEATNFISKYATILEVKEMGRPIFTLQNMPLYND